jgi:undecaprenyl diphosphate synthase
MSESPEALEAMGGPVPKHVAIIMDGNGRWAKEQGKLRVFGHQEGVRSVRAITEASVALGIEVLTLYTFSTENWDRPAGEVSALMELLVKTVRKERDQLIQNGVCLRTIGRTHLLPPKAQAALQEACEATNVASARMTLNLALSYGGRAEIRDAVVRIAKEVASGALSASDIQEAHITDALDTAGLPDPDLLIRTGGDYRISNFLLWQMAYTEIYVTDTYWPAFRRPELEAALQAFQRRERRFGRVLEQ